MKPIEISLVLAVLVIGVYLVVSTAGIIQFLTLHLIGLPMLTFGVVYALLERSGVSLFWGGVLTLIGVMIVTSGDVVLFLGVLLIYIAMFILLKLYIYRGGLRRM